MTQCVSFPNGDLLLLNEEGKLMGLPLNDKASKLWKILSITTTILQVVRTL
jgi:hypothetical protein